MPLRGHHSDIIRRVTCTEGEVRLQMELCPRFDYGSTVPWMERRAESEKGVAWIAKAGPDLTVLRTSVPVEEATPGTLQAQFLLRQGESQSFVLTYGCSYEAFRPCTPCVWYPCSRRPPCPV